MLWQALAAGAIVIALGLVQLYLFVRRNIQGRGDWNEDVAELMAEDLYRGPVCLVLLVVGAILLVVGFLQ